MPLGAASAVISSTGFGAAVETLAESKLDSISDLVSKAVEDANVSHEEYQFILKEKEHYRKMKEEIRAKSKKAAEKITAEQREEILKQGREEGKQSFLAQIAASSDTQTANVTWGGILHLDRSCKDNLFTILNICIPLQISLILFIFRQLILEMRIFHFELEILRL